jgi:hypothetical protein
MPTAHGSSITQIGRMRTRFSYKSIERGLPMRNIWLGVVLGVVTLVLGACSSSSTPASSGSSASGGGAVVGVAIPNQVSVVTANNAN